MQTGWGRRADSQQEACKTKDASVGLNSAPILIGLTSPLSYPAPERTIFARELAQQDAGGIGSYERSVDTNNMANIYCRFYQRDSR